MDCEVEDLLARIAQALARAAPEDWRVLTLRISCAGDMTETGLIATRASGTLDRAVRLDHDGHLAALLLRRAMHQPGKGSWYNAHLTLDKFAQLDAVYDYDNPPFSGDVERRFLVEDQRLYPREPAMLPLWHPCRPGGPTLPLWDDDDSEAEWIGPS
jgi:hypothetical protein